MLYCSHGNLVYLNIKLCKWKNTLSVFGLKDCCVFALCSCSPVPNDCCWSGRWIIVLCEHGWSSYIQSHACQHDRWLFSQSDQMKSACLWIRQGVSMSARQVCFTDVFVSAHLQGEFSSSPSGSFCWKCTLREKVTCALLREFPCWAVTWPWALNAHMHALTNDFTLFYRPLPSGGPLEPASIWSILFSTASDV